MAVYTHINDKDARDLVSRYKIGTFARLTGIEQGVENSNYFLDVVGPDASMDRYVLTLFERRVRERDLPFFMGVMAAFAGQGVTVPRPIAAADASILQQVSGRPAVITSFLAGTQRLEPAPGDCAAMGTALADMHIAATTIKLTRPNDLSLDGWKNLVSACAPGADHVFPGLADFLTTELAWLTHHWPRNLPRSVIHGDLFPDNVFFEGQSVSGIIDFYFACTDITLYDLAICLISWCWREDHWRFENAEAFLRSYTDGRTLTDTEKNALAVLLRGASFRFLLSRLYDWINQVDNAVVHVKNPATFFNLSKFLQTRPSLFGDFHLD